MKTKLQSVETNGTDPLAHARELLQQEAQARQENCSREINAALEKYNCQMSIALIVGDQRVALNQIVTLPGQVVIEAKVIA